MQKFGRGWKPPPAVSSRRTTAVVSSDLERLGFALAAVAGCARTMPDSSPNGGEWNPTTFIALEEDRPSSPTTLGKRPRSQSPSSLPSTSAPAPGLSIPSYPTHPRPLSFSSAFSARPKKKLNVGGGTPRGYANQFAAGGADEFPFGQAMSGGGGTGPPAGFSRGGTPVGEFAGTYGLVASGSVASGSGTVGSSSEGVANPYSLPLPVFDQTLLQAGTMEVVEPPEPEMEPEPEPDLEVDIVVPQARVSSRANKGKAKAQAQTKPKPKPKPKAKKKDPAAAKPAKVDKKGKAKAIAVIPARPLKDRAKQRKSPPPYVPPSHAEVQEELELEREKFEIRKKKTLEYHRRAKIYKPSVPDMLTVAPEARSEEANALLAKARDPCVVSSVSSWFEHC